MITLIVIVSLRSLKPLYERGAAKRQAAAIPRSTIRYDVTEENGSSLWDCHVACAPRNDNEYENSGPTQGVI